MFSRLALFSITIATIMLVGLLPVAIVYIQELMEESR